MNADQVIDLGIKFVRGWEPAPPVPNPGTDGASGLAQTGDFNIAIIAGLILLSLTIVGMVAYAFIKNRKLAGANSSISTVFQQLNFSNFSLRAKIISALVAIVAIACIILACFSTNAHAADGADNPLVPDKSAITATVAEDGTFTLDTCNLTNEGTEKYTIEKSSVSIAQDAKDIKGLDQTNLTINGFGDGRIVFKGNPGDSSEFTPKDLEDLASKASTTLTFAIDLPDDIDIETLFDKQVFKILLTPKQIATWIPMQAKAKAETNPIDFYPAFSTPEQIAGYEFATYDGTNYHEIQKITSMSDIYNALRYPSTGTPTTTLYYQKTSFNAQDLKCYTVKDLSWNYVFGSETTREAKEYSNEFTIGYQTEDGSKNNGIKTALLAKEGFGCNWNIDQPGSEKIPELANDVPYCKTGFYECYGSYNGGLLSDLSKDPWGCCASLNDHALSFSVGNGRWSTYNNRGNKGGVVLARAFN